ncbi:MAG: hypothetical protein Q8K99_01855 [Actinomycetota bacterium]|nr:hypothetical protein [Actinomycetota bacterium]
MEQPEVRDVPESFLERIRKHPAIGIGIAVAVLAISLLLNYYVPRMGSEADGPTGNKIEDPVTAEGTSSASAEASSTTTTADPGSEPSTPDTANDGPAGSVDWPAKPVKRAALLAYRFEGGLWVAKEDGTKPVRVVEKAADGTFSLSPDGKTLAWVNESKHQLHLTDVASAKDRTAGPADSARISWAPDSSWLAFTVETPERAEVRRVARDGTGPATLGVGHSPMHSPDGKSVAYVTNAGLLQAGDVAIAELGGPTVTVKGVGATEVAWGADGLIYAVPGSGTACELRTSARDGSGMRLLVGASKQPRPVMYGSLHVSGDGRLLAYSASGDDGFSRTYTLQLGSNSPIALTVRRDTYPLGWSADGRYILFVEGNAFQGEPVAVLRATPDGLGRAEIVPGGGL